MGEETGESLTHCDSWKRALGGASQEKKSSRCFHEGAAVHAVPFLGQISLGTPLGPPWVPLFSAFHTWAGGGEQGSA